MPTIEEVYERGGSQTLEDIYAGTAPTAGFQETTQSKTSREGAKAAVETVLGAGLPALGTVLGGVGGGVLKGLTGASRLLPFTLPLEMAGAGGGEALNQAVGITPPSNLAIGINAVAPPVGRGVAAAIQHAPRLLPGHSAAMQQQAAAEMRDIPEQLATNDPAKAFARIRKKMDQNTNLMPFPKTITALETMSQREQAALAGVQDTTLISRLNQMMGQLKGTPPVTGPGRIVTTAGDPATQVVVSPGAPGGLTFKEFDATIEALGQQIRDTADHSLRGVYKKLYASVLTDVEAISDKQAKALFGLTNLRAWKQARHDYRRLRAQEELREVIEKRGIRTVSEGIEVTKPNRVMDWIRDNKYFRESLDPRELRSIQDTLERLSHAPSVRGQRGEAAVGSGRRLASVAVGATAGGPLGAVVALSLNESVARLVMSPRGRSFLLRWITAGGGLAGQKTAAVLSAAAVGAFDTAPTTGAPEEE